ncbi:N-acetylgalactosamine-N,N'-diacetylbacillosaminyl-diphospho-undecaprenol 4-alpha-N-acetylgalactosaminyltransferase [Aeromonas hydrophila]|uniref:glycosyltransferase n=1 Tax=Aeromonas hydrophila TaxID=644 RepID=UPI00366B8E76
MNILLVITGLGTGGAETQLCSLADEYVDLGHNVKIVSLNSNIEIKPTRQSVFIETLKFDSKNASSFIKAMRVYLKVVNDFSPDIVHAHMFHANVFCRLSRFWGVRCRLICSAHSQNEGNMLRSLAYRLTDSLCNISTNVSGAAVAAYLRKGCIPNRTRILTMYNGININKYIYNEEARVRLRRELSLSDNENIFLAVGRLTEAKDYITMLTAYSIFLGKCNQHKFKLCVVGDGELKNLIFDKINELSLRDSVILLGSKSNVAEYMSAADFFLLSSRWEGLPSVVGEAMACSRIVVATNAGGTAEWFSGLDYQFISPCVDPELLADNMLAASALNFTQRDLLQRNLRLQIEQKFSISNIANEWIDLYLGTPCN